MHAYAMPSGNPNRKLKFTSPGTLTTPPSMTRTSGRSRPTRTLTSRGRATSQTTAPGFRCSGMITAASVEVTVTIASASRTNSTEVVATAPGISSATNLVRSKSRPMTIVFPNCRPKIFAHVLPIDPVAPTTANVAFGISTPIVHTPLLQIHPGTTSCRTFRPGLMN